MDLITTSAELAAVCDRLARHPIITVDTEFLRETTYYPLLCVVQMASAEEAVVIDTLAPGIDLKPFFDLMTDEAVVVFEAGETFVLSTRPPVGSLDEGAGDGKIVSPMPGKVVTVSVSVGDKVVRGQALMTLEAMKMEHALVAPFDGEVEALSVSAGDQVSEGVSLARLKAAA